MLCDNLRISTKVLFVAGIPPFYRGGGSQATQSYLDATMDIYGRENVDVMIDDTLNIPSDYSDINYIKVPIRTKTNRIIEYAMSYLSRFTRPLISYIDQNPNKYDLCIISGGVAAGKSVQHLRKAGVRVVVVHQNYEVEYHKDNKSLESLGGRYLGAIKRAEGSAYRCSNVNVFLTKQDKELFEKNYGSSSAQNNVVGCFDMKKSEVVSLDAIDKVYDIVISGSLSTYQTTIGISDFNEHYLKIAQSLIPSLKVLLTGRNPSDQICNIEQSSEGVYSVIANPDRIMPVVQKGKIYVCPTCIGGGLKLRAMDGLKCGLPVLVHAVSARGYDYFWDKPYFKVYSDASSFKEGLAQLLSYISNNPDANRIIHTDYYKYFGYDQGVKRFEDSLR